ncbi:class I SAM-dependent methyltransferase [Microbaculum marinum]|uniref:Class I SAM-dependent methyltransferase n=1 Tax=Microbaculum marinum TaxID=1764581 RepID=A0AAW9RGQ7_9HYPH
MLVGAPAQAQQGNKTWWTENTMSYDWTDKVEKEQFSPEWFAEIDQRFIASARHFAHDKQPFDRIIPFEELSGKKVLEVGCGMGLHTELMARAGADVTALDISPKSVEATRTRLRQKGLDAEVSELDAEHLQAIDEFDFIWSWGVIHHSARTGVVLRNLIGALKPGGELRFMVYNLEGMQAYTVIATRYLAGFWFGKSLDEQLWRSTDGFLARYFTRDSISNLCRTFTDDVEVSLCGLEADAVPLPRRLRALVLPLLSDSYIARKVHERGTFLFVKVRKPRV